MPTPTSTKRPVLLLRLLSNRQNTGVPFPPPAAVVLVTEINQQLSTSPERRHATHCDSGLPPSAVPLKPERVRFCFHFSQSSVSPLSMSLASHRFLAGHRQQRYLAFSEARSIRGGALESSAQRSINSTYAVCTRSAGVST